MQWRDDSIFGLRCEKYTTPKESTIKRNGYNTTTANEKKKTQQHSKGWQ